MDHVKSNSEEVLNKVKSTISSLNGTLSVRKLKIYDTVTKPIKEFKEEDMMPITVNHMFKAMLYNSNRLKYPIHILKYFLEENPLDLILTKTELDINTYGEKEMRVDFVATIKDLFVNIEMNRKNTLGRNAHYLFRLCSKKVTQGSGYEYLKGLQINLNDFEPPHDKTMDVFITENRMDDMLIPQIFVNIYIPNLKKLYYNKGIEGLTRFERSILVMVVTKKSEALELAEGDEVMTDYVKEAQEVLFFDEDLREAYDHEAENLRAERELGFEEGREEGIVTGVEQRNAEIAKEMKKQGYSLEKICSIIKVPMDKLSSWLL